MKCKCGNGVVYYWLSRTYSDKCMECNMQDLFPEGTVLLQLEHLPPPIPEEAKTCGYCDSPCGNDWCYMKGEK